MREAGFTLREAALCGLEERRIAAVMMAAARRRRRSLRRVLCDGIAASARQRAYRCRDEHGPGREDRLATIHDRAGYSDSSLC